MRLIFALFLSLIPTLVSASEAQPVRASLVSSQTGFVPGQALTVALRMRHDPHWHSYWRDPGDAGLPTTLEWTLPKGVSASPLLWPKPQVFNDPGGLVGYGYEGDTLLPVELRIAKDAPAVLKLKAKAGWLMCKDICIPGEAALSLELKSSPPPQATEFAARIAALAPRLGKDPAGYGGQADSGEGPGLALMLLFAFLGGLILNLMPCVLPVLSLKVMAFVRQAQESRGRSAALGAAFSAGAIASFWALAGVVLFLKSAGEGVGWGFQFQNPWFVIFMAFLVTGFALNLFGVFELYLPGQANQAFHVAGGREGLPGAFLTGVFMTLLATPCTAPFLGPALGFAFSQGGFTLFAIFSAAGLGLALPYQLLSVFPAAMRWIPKPGPWMVRLRQFMGFPLLLTAAWLLWVLGRQTGVEVAVWGMAFLCVVGLAGWIYGTWAPQGSGWGRLILIGAINLALMGGSFYALLAKPLLAGSGGAAAPAEAGWEAWSEARVAELQAQGRPVFVDFTAAWCWTCKVNEQVALHNPEVLAAFEKHQVAKLKADWTRKDPAISAALAKFKRSGVPFYVVYPGRKGGEAITLKEVITPGQVLQALERAVAR